MIRKAAFASLLLMLLASVFATGAFSVSEAQSPTPLPADARVSVELTGAEVSFSFSPSANSAYVVYFFPNSGEEASVDARLYSQSGLVAAGGGSSRLLEANLNAGEEYTLLLSGTGAGALEVMRATLGRSFETPIELTQGDLHYEKMLVRAGDAHWYAFTAPSDGLAAIHAEPIAGSKEGAPALRGVVLDASGRTIAQAVGDANGFAIECSLVAGARYYVRVWAAGQTTGAYRLSIEQSDTGALAPESISLSTGEISLKVGQRHALAVQVSPQDASVSFSSSDSQVVSVTQSGTLLAKAAGQAIITARTWNGLSATCKVTVQAVPLSGIGFSQSSLSLRVGQSVSTELEFYPANASDRRVLYSVETAGVVSVGSDGVVTGLSEGTARVIALSVDGGHTDILEVTVEAAAPARRALIVGQQMYQDSVNTTRVGSINTAQSIAAMLQSQSVDAQSYETTVLLDSSREETLAAIETAFAGAKEGDVSLFYITCHGYYAHGMSFFQLYDGSTLSARDLERTLRTVPGTVVVIADCCGSGGLIGEASSLEDFNSGIVRVFSGRVGAPSFVGGKYKVIASATLDQDSYRISFDENITESDMATVLGRAICDGAGWSIDRAQKSAMRADLDYDRLITLNELAHFVTRRVSWYLNVAGELAGSNTAYVQTVQVYPQGDPFVLFGR